MGDNTDKIKEAFENPDIISKALADAARDARRRHKQAGNSIVVWRDGEAVWVPADEIPHEEN